MKNLLIIILGMSFLYGCSIDPKSGRRQDSNAPVDLSMWIIAGSNESLVRWDSAKVDSNGNIIGWELINFITRANADGTLTLGPDTYRYYNDSQVIFNWTEAKTGYTGGCGNVPNSCPKHALIRAQVVYPGPNIVPAIVFNESNGISCIISNLLAGAASIVQNCQKANAAGIVVIFATDDN